MGEPYAFTPEASDPDDCRRPDPPAEEQDDDYESESDFRAAEDFDRALDEGDLDW